MGTVVGEYASATAPGDESYIIAGIKDGEPKAHGEGLGAGLIRKMSAAKDAAVAWVEEGENCGK